MAANPKRVVQIRLIIAASILAVVVLMIGLQYAFALSDYNRYPFTQKPNVLGRQPVLTLILLTITGLNVASEYINLRTRTSWYRAYNRVLGVLESPLLLVGFAVLMVKDLLRKQPEGQPKPLITSQLMETYRRVFMLGEGLNFSKVIELSYEAEELGFNDNTQSEVLTMPSSKNPPTNASTDGFTGGVV